MKWVLFILMIALICIFFYTSQDTIQERLASSAIPIEESSGMATDFDSRGDHSSDPIFTEEEEILP